MQLIITEKNDAAKKIAGILASNGVKQDSYLQVHLLPLHRRRRAACRQSWVSRATWCRWTSPRSTRNGARSSRRTLIDAPLVKTETAKSVVRTVKKLAADADALIIATDYDREGELIGLEALNLALEENRQARAHGPAGAFLCPHPRRDHQGLLSTWTSLSEPLARAGEARQDIDLIWGATLTRFVSLATSRLGSSSSAWDGCSPPRWCWWPSGRRSARPSCSEPFWVVKDRAGGRRAERFGAVHKEERFSDEAEATAVFEKLTTPGLVTAVKQTSPQGPAAGAVQHHQLHQRGHLAGLQRDAAMRIAEDLYMAGHISYPRTDNTVYPSSLDLREALGILAQGEFGREAGELLARPELAPQPRRQAHHRPPAHLPHRGPAARRAGGQGVAPLRAGRSALHGHPGRRSGDGVQPHRPQI